MGGGGGAAVVTDLTALHGFLLVVVEVTGHAHILLAAFEKVRHPPPPSSCLQFGPHPVVASLSPPVPEMVIDGL